MKPSIAFSSPDFAASMSSDGIFLFRNDAFFELLPLCGWLFGRPEPSGVLIVALQQQLSALVWNLRELAWATAISSLDALSAVLERSACAIFCALRPRWRPRAPG